ncbi:SIS domain-containing protein [Phaeacidiphilus oryzae]|uniref:SIS domain-containing protein n=1 Tax=Phaeacidiphilus oryzae TaxID=348818 RepID=UPI000AC47CB9|nr:SIS domain-containing protein [Phaeacidiphilus oryzae]
MPEPSPSAVPDNGSDASSAAAEVPSAAAFLGRARSVLDLVAARNADPVRRAAGLVADCVAADGVLQAFGTGHSQAAALELAGRAGGLVPSNRISLADLVLRGGDDRDALADPLLERRPGLAARLYELAGVRAGDLFFIVSSSGVNGAVVDMALLARERGHRLIALTSLAHTRAVEPRHPSGRRLADLADVVLDNGAPLGDAVLPMAAGGGPEDGDPGAAQPPAVCGISSLTSALLVQMVVAEAIGRLVERGIPAPVYASANVPGGFERNLLLERRYEGRLHRTAVG